MQHVITVHDILVVSGIAVGMIVVISLIVGVLSVFASGFKD